MTPALVNTPVLETERLILRAPQATDFDAFASFMAADRSLFVRSGEIDRPKAWRAFGHMTGMWVLRGFGQFILTSRETGNPVGMAGPWYPEGWPEREIGWSLWSAEGEGRGYASEAARAVIAHAFGPLGWDTAVSYIAPDNARSIALAERLGAIRDDSAAHPGDTPCLVYRHPKPEAA